MEVETKGKEFKDSEKSEEGKENSEENKVKGEEKLGGNIVLSGFQLEPIEMIVVKKIVGTYTKKISEKTDYQELKVGLKQSRKD